MTEPEAWSPRCVLCSARGRDTRLESGHCCPACRVRIDDNLRDIVTIADQTAAEPRMTGSDNGPRNTESKPPADLDRIAPYLAFVTIDDNVKATVADVLLSWERIVREERGLAWVGNATAGHGGTSEIILAAKSARASVALLRAHIDWLVADQDFPLELFAHEIDATWRRVSAFALDSRIKTRVVICPTLTDEQDDAGNAVSCGYRLHVRTWLPLDARDDNGKRDWSIGEDVTCKRCGTTRSPEQLIHAAGKESAWADAEAIADWYGIGERTLRRWAANGHIRRDHGRYNIGDVVTHMGASVSA